MQVSNKELLDLVQIVLETYKVRDGKIRLYKENIMLKSFIEENYYKLDYDYQNLVDTYTFNETCQETVPQAIYCFLISRQIIYIIHYSFISQKNKERHMELWDGYFKDGTKANVTLIRDNNIPKGIFHLVCEVLVRHADGTSALRSDRIRSCPFLHRRRVCAWQVVPRHERTKRIPSASDAFEVCLRLT